MYPSIERRKKKGYTFNHKLKQQKIDARKLFDSKIQGGEKPLHQIIHEVRTAHPYLDAGFFRHKIRDLLDSHDPLQFKNGG